MISSFVVSAVNTQLVDGPFTLFLSGLADATYGASEVQVELNPVVPTGLDTSALVDFAFDGSFDPFVHVIDEAYLPDDVFHYIGWEVQLGDTVSFQYDVLTGPDGRGAASAWRRSGHRRVPD